MNKLEFEKLEQEAFEKECKALIKEETKYIWNEIISFCEEKQLEPDPILFKIINSLQSEHHKQVANNGCLTKIN